MTKEKWLSLKIPIKTRRLGEDEGAGFLAWFEPLGEDAILADGETPEEAARNVEELRRDVFDSPLFVISEEGACDLIARYG